jgi:hypothetical protein
MAPPRNWGLPWHMVYPAIAFILITIPTFTSSQSIWLVSANTSTKQIRFGPRDFCGFNRTHGAGTDVYRALGCVYGGTSYTVAKEDLDIVLPSSISYSLSKCAALLYLGECQGEEAGWAGRLARSSVGLTNRIGWVSGRRGANRFRLAHLGTGQSRLYNGVWRSISPRSPTTSSNPRSRKLMLSSPFLCVDSTTATRNPQQGQVHHARGNTLPPRRDDHHLADHHDLCPAHRVRRVSQQQ